MAVLNNDILYTLKENIKPYWKKCLENEFKKPYFSILNDFLIKEYSQYNIFPPKELIFNILNVLDLPDVKVVILSQDPYHEENQAMGFSFSVPKGVKIPPSLKNIYKEIMSEYEIMGTGGDLSNWVNQGVFLLNSVLTVREHKANSHRNKGWEKLTDEIISIISKKSSNVVFMLWGNDAKKKSNLIDKNKHLILEASHPSPLSASRGFFGCNHFKIANRYLKDCGKKEIDWRNF